MTNTKATVANPLAALLLKAAYKNPETRLCKQALTLDADKQSEAQLAKSYKVAAGLLARASAILQA